MEFNGDKQVYLMSARSGYGKTTALGNWIARSNRSSTVFYGVLQIVKDDKRHIRFLSTNETKLLQFNNVGVHAHHHKHSTDKHESCVAVSAAAASSSSTDFDATLYKKCGPYLVSKSVLADCRAELTKPLAMSAASTFPATWIIVDEIGNWELRKNDGYEPAIQQLLSQRQTHPVLKHCKFVIVVRPSLKKQIGIHYKLHESEIGDFDEIYNWQYRTVWPRKLIYAAFVGLSSWILYNNAYRRNQK